MIPRLSFVVAASLALMLPACSFTSLLTGQTSSDAIADEAPHGDIDAMQWLLNYPAMLKNKSAAELNAEQELLNRAWTQHRTENNRLRLAIFHAVAPNGDRARALSLLDVAPNDANGKGRNHPVAQLLIPLLQEARKSDDALQAANQRVKDEQRRADAAQQKLDALRDLEKRMLDRNKTP